MHLEKNESVVLAWRSQWREDAKTGPEIELPSCHWIQETHQWKW